MDRWHDPGLETRGVRPLREHRGIVARFVHTELDREFRRRWREEMRRVVDGDGTGVPRGILFLEDGDDEI